jgi:hypothetical protein
MAKPNPTAGPSRRDVKEVTTIEPAALQEEFVRTPGDIAYWAEQYSVALEAQLTAEADRKRIREEVLLQVRQLLENSGEKATEKVVAAMVETNATYLAAVSADIKADVQKNRVGGILDAVKSKRDILISLGAHIRHSEELHVLRSRRDR